MRRFLPGWLITIILLIISSVTGYGQNSQAITGKVSTVGGDPMGGVTITEKNGTASTTTNAEGNFRINVPSNGVLIFTYVGYTPQEVPVNNQQTISVSLVAAQNSMEEVVVIGYGTQKEAMLPGQS